MFRSKIKKTFKYKEYLHLPLFMCTSGGFNPKTSPSHFLNNKGVSTYNLFFSTMKINTFNTSFSLDLSLLVTSSNYHTSFSTKVVLTIFSFRLSLIITLLLISIYLTQFRPSLGANQYNTSQISIWLWIVCSNKLQIMLLYVNFQRR